jgi:protein gp37
MLDGTMSLPSVARLERDVPFFFKQWGGVQKKYNGRKLNGRTYDEMPTSSALVELRVL